MTQDPRDQVIAELVHHECPSCRGTFDTLERGSLHTTPAPTYCPFCGAPLDVQVLETDFVGRTHWNRSTLRVEPPRFADAIGSFTDYITATETVPIVHHVLHGVDVFYADFGDQVFYESSSAKVPPLGVSVLRALGKFARPEGVRGGGR